MEPGTAVCSAYVNSISRAPHWISCPFRNRPVALHGTHCRLVLQKEDLGISLFRIRALERDHYILGVQRHRRRWSVRRICQCTPDVHCLRTFPSEQKEILRSTAIYLPHGHMDSMGKILLRCRDIMAMARAWKRLCKKHMGHPMV